MKYRLVVFLLCALGLGGCDARLQTKLPPPTAVALKSIPSADFLCWKNFPLGTQVVRRKTMTNSHGKTVVTTTLELKTLNDQLAKVQSQITVDRDNETLENPPDMFQYPANHKIPEEMSAEQFEFPVPDAIFVKKETVRVLDKDYEAAVYQWKATLESGPVGVTGWFSNDFPGRQIRLEFDYSDDTTSVDEVIAVKFGS